MRISFSPQRCGTELSLSRIGDVLTINDQEFDFTALPEGGLLPRTAIQSDWLASDVVRIEGVIHLTLILPHGADAPDETRFPEPMDLGAGPVTLPPFDGITGETR